MIDVQTASMNLDHIGAALTQIRQVLPGDTSFSMHVATAQSRLEALYLEAASILEAAQIREGNKE